MPCALTTNTNVIIPPNKIRFYTWSLTIIANDFSLPFERVDGGGGTSRDGERKKRPRTAFTAAQIKTLEAEFERNKYLSVSKRIQLSKALKLTETQVRIFFPSYLLLGMPYLLHGIVRFT